MRLLLAARLSKLQRDGREGIGLDTQESKSKAFAERNDHEIVHVAADTKSGTTAPWNRKNLKAWVTEAEKMAQYDGILVYATDRISRGSDEDFAHIESWASKNGKKIIVVNPGDGIWFPSRGDSDYWQWAATKREARREWENDRERSMRAQDELRDRGKLVGRPPFGYTTEGAKYDRRLVPTDQGRELVPVVFEKVIAGEPLPDIAEWLKAQTGRSWWAGTVAGLVRCPTYKGMRCEQDAATKKYGRLLHKCPPLVDADTWRRANANLAGRAKRGKFVSANRAMLGNGVLLCAKCGAKMYRIKSGRANKLFYYRCAGTGTERRVSHCRNMVRVEVADAAVDRIIHRALGRPVVVEKVIPGYDFSKEVAEVEDQLQQLAFAGLSAEEYMKRAAELLAVRDEFSSRASEDRIVYAETGERYSDVWDALPVHERADWLKANGFYVTADRSKIEVDNRERGKLGWLAPTVVYLDGGDVAADDAGLAEVFKAA